MSWELGQFRIAFYTGNGSKDAETAKRAYDWCMENYPWFRGESDDGSGRLFLLNENEFKINEELFPYGPALDDEAPSELDWLTRPFNEVKATRLAASIWRCNDKYEDEASYEEFLWQKNGTLSKYSVGFNNYFYPPMNNNESFCGNYACEYTDIDDEDRYCLSIVMDMVYSSIHDAYSTSGF